MAATLVKEQGGGAVRGEMLFFFFPNNNNNNEEAALSINDILLPRPPSASSPRSGALSSRHSPLSPIIAFMLFLLYRPGHEMPKLIILWQCRCN